MCLKEKYSNVHLRTLYNRNRSNTNKREGLLRDKAYQNNNSTIKKFNIDLKIRNQPAYET